MCLRSARWDSYKNHLSITSRGWNQGRLRVTSPTSSGSRSFTLWLTGAGRGSMPSWLLYDNSSKSAKQLSRKGRTLNSTSAIGDPEHCSSAVSTTHMAELWIHLIPYGQWCCDAQTQRHRCRRQGIPFQMRQNFELDISEVVLFNESWVTSPKRLSALRCRAAAQKKSSRVVAHNQEHVCAALARPRPREQSSQAERKVLKKIFYEW